MRSAFLMKHQKLVHISTTVFQLLPSSNYCRLSTTAVLGASFDPLFIPSLGRWQNAMSFISVRKKRKRRSRRKRRRYSNRSDSGYGIT